MNKLKGWLALVLLLLSWCALYWITGSRTPWNQFHVNNDGSGVSVYLGDIRWQYKSADFVGSDASQRSYPSVVHCSR